MNVGVAAGGRTPQTKPTSSRLQNTGAFTVSNLTVFFPAQWWLPTFLFLRGDGGANLRAETLTDSPVYLSLSEEQHGLPTGRQRFTPWRRVLSASQVTLQNAPASTPGSIKMDPSLCHTGTGGRRRVSGIWALTVQWRLVIEHLIKSKCLFKILKKTS